MVIHNIIEMQRHNRGQILPKLVTLFYAISEPTESDKRYWSHKIMSLSMIFGQNLKHYDRYVYIASGLGAKTNEPLDDERDIWRKTIKIAAQRQETRRLQRRNWTNDFSMKFL